MILESFELFEAYFDLEIENDKLPKNYLIDFITENETAPRSEHLTRVINVHACENNEEIDLKTFKQIFMAFRDQ